MINYKAYIDKKTGIPFVHLIDIKSDSEILTWNSEDEFCWNRPEILESARIAKLKEYQKFQDMLRMFPLRVYKVIFETYCIK